ncbi:MAG: 2OG-Fe(II) oxygenase [Rhodospirillales bacterium]
MERQAADGLETCDWTAIARRLETQGAALTGPILTPDESSGLATLFDEETLFRKTIVMQRHGYGAGCYRYFANPLPQKIAGLRWAFYARLVELARAWSDRLDLGQRYPHRLDDYLMTCHAAGQKRPTPLLLRYGPGDYNRLHQDLYGALYFPLQVVVQLSDPAHDFEGGDLVLVESRARMQGRAQVLRPAQGEAAIFANSLFPAPGKRGPVRAQLRHGVSEVTRGKRTTLGLIFHDAA